jgi:transposase
MNYIGMDIHKQFTFAVVKDENGKELAKEKFENSRENFSKFLEIYPSNNTKIVMESTCVWEYIYEILEEMKYDVKLANPSRTKAIAYARIKTDAVDASTLADLLRANLVAESYIPPKEVRRLREITRERKTFVKQTTQIKNKIHAILIKRGIKFPNKTFCMSAMLWLKDKFDNDDIIHRYANLLEFHEEEIDFIEGKIRKVADESKDAKLLMTIPGIAELRAVNIMAEIGEISRFQSGSKLCSYAGLVPSIKQSGNSLRFGKLMKQSSKTLKNDLIETSWVVVRTKESNPLQEFYKRLAKKKGKQKAICATARKLCCIVYAILSRQKEFMVL